MVENANYNSVKRYVQGMQTEIDSLMEADAKDLHFLNSQHSCIYDAIYKQGDAELDIEVTVEATIRVVYSYVLITKEVNCMQIIMDACSLEGGESWKGPYVKKLTKQVFNPKHAYGNVRPSKSLPVV